MQGSNLRPLPCESRLRALRGQSKCRDPFGIKSLLKPKKAHKSPVGLMSVAFLWRYALFAALNFRRVPPTPPDPLGAWLAPTCVESAATG